MTTAHCQTVSHPSSMRNPDEGSIDTGEWAGLDLVSLEQQGSVIINGFANIYIALGGWLGEINECWTCLHVINVKNSFVAITLPNFPVTPIITERIGPFLFCVLYINLQSKLTDLLICLIWLPCPQNGSLMQIGSLEMWLFHSYSVPNGRILYILFFFIRNNLVSFAVLKMCLVPSVLKTEKPEMMIAWSPIQMLLGQSS